MIFSLIYLFFVALISLLNKVRNAECIFLISSIHFFKSSVLSKGFSRTKSNSDFRYSIFLVILLSIISRLLVLTLVLSSSPSLLLLFSLLLLLLQLLI